jgi:transposase
MSRSIRVFSKEFNAKVVLEALKEKRTIEVLFLKYELLPNQIKNISAVCTAEKPK